MPVAVHADHYGIKGDADIEKARVEIPSMFDAGTTSIAIDASHMPDDKNLLASIELNKYVPAWAGLETEQGEIKGKEGLSNKEEALFLIQGLNAHGICPDWIALNNGTTHGIEASDAGIQVGLTAEIHEAVAPYKVSGAQHGTSGNSSERLRHIAAETHTTKANVATALQMISWGVKVNDYGNAELDANGEFIKVPGQGVTEEVWAKMVAFAKEKGWKKGDYKKLNLPFENILLGQPREVRERMAQAVEEFTYHLLVRGLQRARHGAAGDRGDPEGRLARPRPEVRADRGPGGLDAGEDRRARQGAHRRQGPRGGFLGLVTKEEGDEHQPGHLVRDLRSGHGPGESLLRRSPPGQA